MLGYFTVYTRRLRRGTRGALVETHGCVYHTKSLTTLHANIRAKYPDAQTWKDPERVITDFVPGTNLGMLPLVRGGERVSGP